MRIIDKKNFLTTQEKQIDNECQTEGGYSSIMDRNITEENALWEKHLGNTFKYFNL
jgi:hypothetical protein